MITQGPDATIPFSFAQGRQDAANSYHNPLGAYTSPATSNASKNALINTASMSENVANQSSTAQNAQGNFAKQATLTGMTMPQMTSQTNTQQGGFWSSLLTGMVGNAAGAASAAM